ncbi:uncharacterized protein ACA1_310750 [Acanthamoeba castellanii str. Neff]|uniref:RFX-type winged-helix domain-containing protein n=1 Tax=Acanthamoeba castellanii (strain ATCC 30010 / Neff) TaxID=1257118 RepID=L8GVY4_ACACF|nr:uncharacterized protein ACA1_310750 [Acanthamoeba castellanii str. Neff]ELR16246.1 hypothetical protein ACA1_310750 [Acanthamoeba castellanii str. Neff]
MMMTNNQSSSIFLKSKEEAMPHILIWLGRTYVEKPGSMLLKKDVHAAYSAFCAEHRFETTTNAAFGKMFKRVFPSAEVRRLVKHNETTFFYENMTSQSASGNAPLPSSSSPGNGNGSPRPASESTPVREQRPRLEGSTHSPKRRRATAKEKGRLGSGDTNKRRSVKSEEEEEEDGTEAELARYDQKGFGREERTAVRPERASAAVSVPVGEPQLASWTSDAQLGFTDTLHRFCQLYRHEIWGFFPINPSMVEYPTLSYIFNTDHGTAERSALSVAAHYVVSMGYLLLGDVTHGREFFWKAREHLSYVFDSSNYDVACLLKHMSWAAMLFSGTGSEGHERETYYLSLCKNICQMLGVCRTRLATINSLLGLQFTSI